MQKFRLKLKHTKYKDGTHSDSYEPEKLFMLFWMISLWFRIDSLPGGYRTQREAEERIEIYMKYRTKKTTTSIVKL